MSRGVTYRAIHTRVARVRGAAKSHVCVECGDRAHAWALIPERGALYDADGLRYSDDVDDYQPMCQPCHMVMDRGVRRCPHGPDRVRDAGGACAQCKRDRMAAKRADPEWNEARNARRRTPEAREVRNARLRERYATDPAYREKMKAEARANRRKSDATGS